MVFPLPFRVDVPVLPHPGAFGSVRKYDIHTGIDLYCSEGTVVQAIEPGKVVSIEEFTGEKAGSPWWNTTQAVLVEGSFGVILYGELRPSVRLGQSIAEGEAIGTVLRVLKHDKGLPTAMLHLELYEAGSRESVWWRLNEEKPRNLLDPINLLKERK